MSEYNYTNTRLNKELNKSTENIYALSRQCKSLAEKVDLLQKAGDDLVRTLCSTHSPQEREYDISNWNKAKGYKLAQDIELPLRIEQIERDIEEIKQSLIELASRKTF